MNKEIAIGPGICFAALVPGAGVAWAVCGGLTLGALEAENNNVTQAQVKRGTESMNR